MPARHRSQLRALAAERDFDPWARESATCGSHYNHDSLGAVDLAREHQMVRAADALAAAATQSPPAPAHPTAARARMDAARVAAATEYAREQRAARQQAQKEQQKPTANMAVGRVDNSVAQKAADRAMLGRREMGAPSKLLQPPRRQQPKQQHPQQQQQQQQRQLQLPERRWGLPQVQQQDKLPERHKALEKPVEGRRQARFQEPEQTTEQRALQERIARQRAALGLHPDPALGDRIASHRELQMEAAAEAKRKEAERLAHERAPTWWPREAKRVPPPQRLARPPSPATVKAADARLRQIWLQIEGGEEISDDEMNDMAAILELKKLWKQAAEAAEAAEKEKATSELPSLLGGRPFRANGHEAASLIASGWGL